MNREAGNAARVEPLPGEDIETRRAADRQSWASSLLPCLGDPAAPLGTAAWRIGAQYLGLEQLAIFRAAALPRLAHSG